MITSILGTEETWGTVTRVVVPAKHVDDVKAKLLDAARADLADLVEPGDPGRMIVVAGGREWPFGGL